MALWEPFSHRHNLGPDALEVVITPHRPDDVVEFAKAHAEVLPHLPGSGRAALFTDFVFGLLTKSFAAAANPERSDVHH